MKSIGATQQSLADALGCSRANVGHKLNGLVDCGASELVIIARELRVSLDWLLTGESPRQMDPQEMARAVVDELAARLTK